MIVKEKLEEALAAKDNNIKSFIWKGAKEEFGGEKVQSEYRLVDCTEEQLRSFYQHCKSMLYNTDKAHPGRYVLLDIIKEQRDIPKLLHNFELIGGGGTDFRPAFSYINKLLENGEFQNLKGVLYFTDGKGIYPAKRPPYETAFLFLGEEEHPVVPAWAMKLILHEEDL